MNEFDPKPSRVVPLEYARPAAQRTGPGASFVVGCMASLGLLIGLPIVFGGVANDPAFMGYGVILAMAIILGGIIWAFIRGKRAFGRGLIFGPLMIVCLILLLVGICALMVSGIGK
jgi:hypothetical protein